MREMTVTQLSAYIKGVFDDEELLHDITLSGEVAEVSYSDKHTFIVLAEGDFSVRCVHFFSRDQIEKGMRVALRGSVGFYDRRGIVSFSYSEFFACGEGNKIAQFMALKEKLRAQGLFSDRAELPEYITSVIVITSPDGAAIRDFIRVVRGKCAYVDIRVYPVKVQGVGAAHKMAAAIKKLQGAADALVLCRGGGSDEDLDCFNDEELAVAVAESKTPVISAVGHEVDYTLCDFCAGTRAGTPSIAGQIVADRAAAIKEDILYLIFRARAAVMTKFKSAAAALDRLGLRITGAVDGRLKQRFGEVEVAARRGLYAIDRQISDRRNDLVLYSDRLSNRAQNASDKRRRRLEKLSAVLNALDPNKIRPGYAAVFLDGKNIDSVSAVKKGDDVKLIFKDGEAEATVTRTACTVK